MQKIKEKKKIEEYNMHIVRNLNDQFNDFNLILYTDVNCSLFFFFFFIINQCFRFMLPKSQLFTVSISINPLDN